MRRAIPIVLSDEERATLTNWARSRTAPARLVTRARIVLAAADGAENQDIAAELGLARGTVMTWRKRFAADRLAGIEQERQALAVMDHPNVAAILDSQADLYKKLNKDDAATKAAARARQIRRNWH